MNQFKTRAGDTSCVFVVFLPIYKYIPNTIITWLWWLHRKEENNMKHLPSSDSGCHLKVSGNHNQVFMSPREQNNLNASNKSLLAYCSTPPPLLSLIVSCLLGSQTCWWPLKSVTLCVCGSVCVLAFVMVCGCVRRGVWLCVWTCHYLCVQLQHELTLCSVKLSYFLLFLSLITCLRAKKWSFVPPT